MEEEWAPISAYPLYSVSTHGNVYSRYRKSLVKQSSNGRGIVKVSLFQDGRTSSRSVNLLVAQAFLTHKYDTFTQALLEALRKLCRPSKTE